MDAITLKTSLLRSLFLCAFVLALSACGGGGGGGGGEDPIRIDYSGNTNPAVITKSNATKLVANILIGQTLVESGSGGAFKTAESYDVFSESIGFTQTPRRIALILRDVIRSSANLASRMPNLQARTDINEIDSCANKDGSIHITGFVEDNGTGLLTLDFINCRDGGETLDGKITIQVNAFDFGLLLPTDAILGFSVLTLSNPTFNISLDGSMRSQISIGTQTEQLTIDRLVARDNATGEMLMMENQTSIINYDNIFFPSSLSESISGRIYDSIYGYIDFTTIASIVFSSITQEYPESGQLLLTGDLNHRIQVTVISDTHISLDLDLDGDTNFELAYTLGWPEIEAETDLTDSDSDGMHDSWELNYGLNPLDGTDALLDTDNDGFTNIEEYLASTDPNNPQSSPPPAPPVVTTLQTSDIIYHPVDGKIYASIPAGAASGSNSIAILDPHTGQVETTILIGIDPGPLAISDDGRILYAGLNGTATVRQFFIQSQTPGLEFGLGSDSHLGPYYAEDIEVLPGDSSAVAVSRKYLGVSPRHAGVSIYDNGVSRTNATAGHTGSNVIEFDSSPANLYGYNNETTEFGFRTMSVDSAGVTTLDVTQNLIGGFAADIKYSNGRIYTTNGQVINPITKTLIGSFVLNASTGLVEPDAATGRVFFLTAGASSNTWILQVFDANNLGFLNSMEISNVNGNPTSLIRWGVNGLAFRTSQNQVFFIQTTLVQ